MFEMNLQQQLLQTKRDLDALNSIAMSGIDFNSLESNPSVPIDTAAALDDLNKMKFFSQFDDSFEPISVVTPPKKRAKTDTMPSLYNPSSYDMSGSEHQLQLLSYLDMSNATTNLNLQEMAADLNRGDPIQYPFSNATSILSPKRRMQSIPFTARRPSFFNANNISTALVSEGSEVEDMFEPLFIDPSQLNSGTALVEPEGNHVDKNPPDVCASSSSLPEEGQFIIKTSDSFKENDYAKAEVVPPCDPRVRNLGLSMNQNSYQPIRRKISESSSSSTVSSSSATSKSSSSSPPLDLQKDPSSRFKPFHEEKWNFHYEELLTFKRENGHCLVPHTYPPKPHLARWVKRQRRQYKLKAEGNKNSTMTEERIKILNEIGFVWDSHEVVWNERFTQLVEYKRKNGHCRVPSYCKECPQLASWVKCQRRQYKLYWEEGKGSSMNLDRIKLLNSIGFIWEVHPSRKRKETEKHFQHIANILMDS